MKPTKEITQRGNKVTEWNCNLSEDGLIKENGSIEAIYEYKSQYYSVRLNQNKFPIYPDMEILPLEDWIF